MRHACLGMLYLSIKGGDVTALTSFASYFHLALVLCSCLGGSPREDEQLLLVESTVIHRVLCFAALIGSRSMHTQLLLLPLARNHTKLHRWRLRKITDV